MRVKYQTECFNSVSQHQINMKSKKYYVNIAKSYQWNGLLSHMCQSAIPWHDPSIWHPKYPIKILFNPQKNVSALALMNIDYSVPLQFPTNTITSIKYRKKNNPTTRFRHRVPCKQTTVVDCGSMAAQFTYAAGAAGRSSLYFYALINLFWVLPRGNISSPH